MKTLHLAFLLLFVSAAAMPPRVVDAAPRAGTQVELAARAPAVVFLIRHAEKPMSKDPNLSPMGFRRAELIPTLFLPPAGPSKRPLLPRPDALFATAPSKHSNRPIETLTPLSQALHLRINANFSDDDVQPLANELLSGRYAGKVILIAWHHGEIPRVAEALGVADAPQRWDEAVFDQIWRMEWIDGKVRFSTLPEGLLAGDAIR